MTVRELLIAIDDAYPSATTDTQKIKYMNKAQDTLSEEFGLVSTDTSLVTAAHNDRYPLASTPIQDISQIETFEISNSVPDLDSIVASSNMKVGAYTLAGQPKVPSMLSFTHVVGGGADTLGTIDIVGISGGETKTETITPVAYSTVYSTIFYSSVTSITGADWVINGANDLISVGTKAGRYDAVRYKIGYKDDSPMSGQCIYQGYSSTGLKSIIVYPAPSFSGLQITIRYRSKLTELTISDLEVEPDFDERYHNLLAVFACWQICANGSSPDYVQANRFSAEWNEGLSSLWKKTEQEKITAPRKRRYNKHWDR